MRGFEGLPSAGSSGSSVRAKREAGRPRCRRRSLSSGRTGGRKAAGFQLLGSGSCSRSSEGKQKRGSSAGGRGCEQRDPGNNGCPPPPPHAALLSSPTSSSSPGPLSLRLFSGLSSSVHMCSFTFLFHHMIFNLSDSAAAGRSCSTSCFQLQEENLCL